MRRSAFAQAAIWLLGVVGVSLVSVTIAHAANGTPDYLDLNGSAPGFDNGTTTSVTQTGSFWDTSNAGTGTVGAFVSGDQLTIGNSATDFAGRTISINLDGGNNLAGVLINSTSVNITLTGTSNTHLSTSQTWTIAAGSTLTVNDTRQSFDTTNNTVKGMNWNNETTTFQGGGTITFATPFGANSSTALITENMPGGIINIQIGTFTDTTTISYGGNFTLTAGTLNFASAGSALQFGSATSHTVTIGGGTIDNTSGSALTLSMGGGSYNVTGDFSFTGTNSLDLGTASMALTSTRQITVGNNTLTIDGAISGSGSGLTKAGAGTLLLTNATNGYSGLTTISNGKLQLSEATNTNNIASSSGIIITGPSSTLDVSGVTSGSGFALAGTQSLTNNGGTVTGNVTVNSGQSLTGSGGTFNGASGNNTITINGSLVPGSATTMGTMSMSNLVVNSGSNWKIKLGGATGDLIAVSGNANFAGGDSVLSVLPLSSLSASSYQVLTAGSLTGLTPGTLTTIGRTTYSIDSAKLAANVLQIDLGGGPANLAWTGGASLNWDNLQTDANWIRTDGGTNDTMHFYDGDNVVFDDSHNAQASPTTINIANNVAPTSVTLTNGSAATPNTSYIFSGTGSITAGSLLMNSSNGTGSLTINTTNTYSGGTTVQSGTINANATGALGTGVVNVTGGTLNLNVANAMGSATLSLTSGNLNFANASATAGTIVFGGGTFDNTSGAAITLANNALSWTGSFAYAGSNTPGDTTHDISFGTGTVSLDGSNATLTMGGSASTLTVGGTIQNGVSGTGFTVAGVGKLLLNGTNTYTGVTTINGGTVVVNNSASLGAVVSAADVVIGNGAAVDLVGNGTANQLNFGDKTFKISGVGSGTGVLVNSGQLTQENAFNFITLAGNATIGGYRMDIGRTPAPAAAGALNLNGHTLTVAMTTNGVATGPQPLFDILDKVVVSGNGSIDVTSGALGIERGASATAANVTGITFETGTNMQIFQNTAGSVTVPMTFKGNNILGSGSGTVGQLDSPIIMQSNLTLESLAGGFAAPATNNLMILAGNITDGGVNFSITQVSGTTTLSGAANSWIGGTFIQGGTIKYGSTAGLPTGSSVTLGTATGGSATLDLNGFSPTLGGITEVSGGNGIITNSSTTTSSTLTYAGGTSVFAGTIQDLGSGTTTLGLNVASGTLTLTGGNSYRGNTTVSGGTLQIGAGDGSALGFNPNVIVNSGTLDLNSTSLTIGNLSGTGGVITNTAASSTSTVTVGTTANSTYGGAIQDNSGFVALTKQGSGKLTLSGANTYSGDTNINAGTLNVTGSLASGGNVNVNSTATLSGDGNGTSTGVVGNVNLQGGTVNPGTATGAVGKLTMHSLTVNGGNLQFDIGNTGNNDQVAVANTANFQISANIVVTPTSNPFYFTQGTYTLLTSAALQAGQGGGPGTAPTFAPPMARQTVSLDYSTPNTIKLDVIDAGQQATLTWNNSVGGGDGQSWDVGTNKNWTSSATILDPNKFYNGDNVVFNDNNNFPANTNAYNINITSSVSPGSVTVNTSSTYTFSGSGSITGATSLTKAGTGTLALSNSSNSYSGGTFVQNGTLQVGSSNALSPNSVITLGDTSNDSGVLDLNGNTVSVGGLAVVGSGAGNIVGNSSTSSSATLSFNGGTSSFGGIIQDAINGGTQTTALNVVTGTLKLTGPSTYTGSTTIASGATLQVGDNTASGSIVGNNIDDEGSLAFARTDSSFTFSGNVFGAGKLLQNGAGTTTLTNSNSYIGGTVLNAGILAITSDAAISNAAGGITFAGGTLQFNNYGSTNMLATSFNNAGNVKLGASGSPTASLNAVGAGGIVANGGSTFSTVIAGTTSLTYVGPGTLMLNDTTNNTYTGNTTITGGTLVVLNNASLGSLTSGVVNINGGTLDLGQNTTTNNQNFGAKQFNIAGTGPAGGFGAAIYNTGVTQDAAFGKITLTADAAIGGVGPTGSSNGRIDLRNSTPTLDLQGHKLTKVGASQLSLVATQVNSTGGTPGTIEVAGGELGIETTSAVTSTAVSSITMDANTRLEFFDNVATPSTVTSPIIIAGAGVAIGTGDNVANTIASPITLQNDLTFEPINTNAVSATSNFPLTMTGNISESGGPHAVTKLGVNTLTLSGNNSYTGGTTVSAGTLVLGSLTAMGANTGMLTVNTSGTLDLHGFSPTIGGLNGTGGIISSAVAGSATLTLGNGNATGSAAVSIQNGAGGPVALTKIGIGVQTLTGASTYTGITTIAQGTLSLGVTNATPTTSQVILNGGTLSTGGLNQDMTQGATPAPLTLSSSSIIDFGTGTSILKFADSSGQTWSGTLTINNWSGTPTTGGGTDQLFVGITGTGLTSTQLADIDFTGFSPGASILSDGEVVPTSTGLLLGDINQDGHVNAADLGDLMLALTNLSAYEAEHPTLTPTQIATILDVNQDGHDNNADLQSLINYLLAGHGSNAPVPEPASWLLLGLGGTALWTAGRKRK